MRFEDTITSCPICSFSNTKAIQTLYDDRYGYPGLFKLNQCQKCGHTFLQCDFSPDQITELYSLYYPRSTFEINKHTPPQEAHGIRSWLNGSKMNAFRWIPQNVRVLDIGCGFGESLGYHKKRGCDAYGVEADENAQRVTDKFGYKIHVGLFDPNLYQPNFFDFITMDQVIEHMSDPLKTLHGITHILKPGGRVIISTPNAKGWGATCFSKYWINWHAPYHLHFFSKKSIQLTANQVGLQIIKSKTITSSDWLLYQWIHISTYPQLNSPSVFWDTRKRQNDQQKLTVKRLSLMHKTTINHFIMRFFDILGFGDNHLFILSKP